MCAPTTTTTSTSTSSGPQQSVVASASASASASTEEQYRPQQQPQQQQKKKKEDRIRKRNNVVFGPVRECLDAIVYHYREGNMNWPMFIYIALVHIVATTGLFYVTSCKAETLIFAFLLWPISGFGITVGVHRLWSHRSYEAHWTARVLLMLLNSIANQGSIFHWARDHRVHHKYSETHADPHNATRGFFFAHMGWLLIKKHPDVVAAGRAMDFTDLLEDPVVSFQKRFDPWFALYMCFVMPAQVCVYAFGETSFWNGFFVAGALRYCTVLHFTWLVNSAAHLYGDHPYDVLSYPAENPLVSLASVGEGWHNWHHKYPFDYAASEFGITSQFNPSKLIIDLMASIGLVWNRKRGGSAWAMGRARRDRDAANGIPLPKAPPRPWEIIDVDDDDDDHEDEPNKNKNKNGATEGKTIETIQKEKKAN